MAVANDNTAAASEGHRGLDPMLLLGSLILLAALLTWILPAGQFQRLKDPQSGQTLVIPGSFKEVPRHPVGLWGALLAIPQGLKEAAEVLFFVLLAGGMLTVVEATGAIGNLLAHMARRFEKRPFLVLVLVSLLFLIGGASDGMYEEILAFIPLLCALMRRLRMDVVMALGISVGTATVAGCFSPFNAFLLGVSQPLAELPVFSGFAFRAIFFILALAIWTGYLAWYAKRGTKTKVDIEPVESELPSAKWKNSDIGVLVVFNAGMAVIVAGGIVLHWGLAQFSAVFILMGIVSGLIAGMGWRGISTQFAEGFRRLIVACVLIGLARAISVVLSNGLILDTVANALFSPLRHFSPSFSAMLTVLSESALAIPIPSESGRAVVSLPIIVPLSDLLAIPRQVVVFAYQSSILFGCLASPTAGPTLAMLSVARISYGRWARFILPPVAMLLALSMVAVVAGVKIGLH